MSAPKQAETPLFARFYDWLAWLTACLEKFPRAQRFLLPSRLLDTSYACYGELIRARKVTEGERRQALLQADIQLELLRVQWRLAHDQKCVSISQYEHGARLLNEVGRLLGGWRK